MAMSQAERNHLRCSIAVGVIGGQQNAVCKTHWNAALVAGTLLAGLLGSVATAQSTSPKKPAASSSPAGKVAFGKVVGVTNGDTLTLLIGKTRYKIRLAGIDAPELNQAFGAKARQTLSARVFGKTVKVQSRGRDRHGKILGIVWADGQCANVECVRAGMAWHSATHSSSAVLAQAEQKARAKRAGLWVDKNPVPPWEFRRRSAKANASTVVRKAERTTATSPESKTGDIVYVTKTSVKYHRAGCWHLAKSKIPMPLGEAASRYAPCKACRAPARPLPKVKPAPPVADSHWLTRASGTRHNKSCKWFHKSEGRPCGPTAGKACKICGG